MGSTQFQKICPPPGRKRASLEPPLSPALGQGKGCFLQGSLWCWKMASGSAPSPPVSVVWMEHRAFKGSGICYSQASVSWKEMKTHKTSIMFAYQHIEHLPLPWRVLSSLWFGDCQLPDRQRQPPQLRALVFDATGTSLAPCVRHGTLFAPSLLSPLLLITHVAHSFSIYLQGPPLCRAGAGAWFSVLETLQAPLLLQGVVNLQ